MGGNALAKFGVETVRLPAKEYFQLCVEILGVLWFAEHRQSFVIDAYKTKESFGDVDILYTGSVLTKERLLEIFPDTKAVYKNGTVISFEYKNFQVDLIWSSYDTLFYAKGYYSYNDICGNLVGCIAHKFGLKHGHDGLYLPIRDGDNMFASILLTVDIEKTYRMLGLDVERFRKGFETREEGFDWVSKSPYYDPEIYKLENRNTIARVRDKKRITYNAFLRWGEEWSKTNLCFVGFTKDKMDYLPFIFEHFPEAEEQYKAEIHKLGFSRYIKTKFSGDIVRKITGLQERELGMFMKYLRGLPQFTPEYLALRTDDQIKDMVENFHGTWETVV